MSTGSPCLTRRRHHTRRGCTQHQKAQQPTTNAPLSKPACLTVSWSSGSASLSESSDIDTSIAQRGALGQLCDGVDEQRLRASAARRAPFAVGSRPQKFEGKQRADDHAVQPITASEWCVVALSPSRPK